MAYDPILAGRVRGLLSDRPAITERKMFGGLAFMSAGKMFAGIVGDDLMARVGPDQMAAALARPHVREMDFTGRVSNTMVYVAPAGIADDGALRSWLDEALTFTADHEPARKRTRRS